MNTNCVHGALVGAWHHFPDELDRLQEFVDILDGKTRSSEKHDLAAIKLRDYLLSYNSKGKKRNGTWRKMVYLMTENCIQDFMDYKTLRAKEPKPANSELFALPEYGGTPRQKNLSTKP